MNEAIVRYLAGLLLCVVVALAYAATRRKGVRAVLLDSAFCLGCMLAVVAAVAAAVHLLCAMK
ncbi:MAG: hypothetical protein ISS72_09470 [Candidatus Brocadiae bacterium]|nr:hypothetical protein [Candidatus Brocadiia bacterium]